MISTSEQRPLTDLHEIAKNRDAAAQRSDVGEENHVVFAESQGQPISVKIPRDGGHPRCIFREAFSCAVVRDYANDIPLETPRVINFSEDAPRYIAYLYMPGVNLSLGEVQALGADEQYQIGKATGSFAASLGRLILPDEYPEIAEPLRQPDLMNWRMGLMQSRIINRQYGDSAQKTWRAFEEAANRTLNMTDEVSSCEVKDIFGHGDLRPDNMLFREKLGKFTLGSIIDFGIAGMATPEYELRHMPLISPEAFEGAASAYQADTGNPIDETTTLFWARIQIINGCLNRLALGNPIPDDRMHSLEQVFPDIDFREEA